MLASSSISLTTLIVLSSDPISASNIGWKSISGSSIRKYRYPFSKEYVSLRPNAEATFSNSTV